VHTYKPVDELARSLQSFKRPTRPQRTSTVYRLFANFTWGYGNDYAKCFFSQSSKTNELI